MTSLTSMPSLEDVLAAFAVEPVSDRATLETYLRRYPQFAMALIDLSHELLSVQSDFEGELEANDHALLDRALAIHDAATSGPIQDPFQGLSREELNSLANDLGVPRQILMALRERCVEITSIPAWVLQLLAARLRRELSNLFVYFTYPPNEAFARSFKSDGKPDVGVRITFEQALIEAGISEEKRKSLLADR